MLSPTLKFAASVLKLETDAELSFEATQLDEMVLGSWGEFSFGIKGSKRINLVIADIYDSHTESSYEKVSPQEGDALKLVSSLSWVSDLALRKHAKYCFILTPDHIILCGEKIEGDGASKRWCVMPVPLFGTSPNGFTAELGLWTLCMLALTDHALQEGREQGEADTNSGRWTESPWLKKFKSEFESEFVVDYNTGEDVGGGQMTLV